MTDKEKELAAIAGVMAMLSDDTTDVYVPRQSGNQPSSWQSYGRQQTMQYRDTAQRRLIKRSR